MREKAKNTVEKRRQDEGEKGVPVDSISSVLNTLRQENIPITTFEFHSENF